MGFLKQWQAARVLMAVGVSFLLVSCDQPSNSPSGGADKPSYKFTVVLYSSAGNPFWSKVIYGAQEMAGLLGCEVDAQYANNDPVRQNDIIETAIANQVDGIGVALNYDDAYDEVVKKARDKGIPVICLNTDDSQGAAGNARMAYIGQDLRIAGEMIARRLVQDGGLKAGDKVVCPVEHPDAAYAVGRYEGAKKVFDASGVESEILNSGHVSLEENLNRITQYLLGHQDIDGVLALGGMPMEMTPQAIQDAGLKIPNAGFDITKQIGENIRDGRTLATVDQQPFYQGSFTIMQLFYTRRYGMIPCDINTSGGIIDKTNVGPVIELADRVR